MRHLLAEMISLPTRRPTAPRASSFRNRAHRSVQRRKQSTESANKTESSPAEKAPTEGQTADVAPAPSESTPPPPPPPAELAASSAGAASPSLQIASSRTAWEVVKASPIGRFGRWYTNAQNKRPYVTQLASSLIIYLCGDLSAQLLFPSDAKPSDEKQEAVAASDSQDADAKDQKVGGYDPLRTLRHLTVGLVSSIPSYKWFMFLHHNFNYASKFLSILTKVCVQQAVFTPVFNSYFFAMQSLLSGATLDETWERLKKAVPTSIYNSVKLWPAVTAFSFMYIPPHFRSVFGGSIAVGWQTYLSWLNQKAAREVAAAEAAAQPVHATTALTPQGHRAPQAV